MSECEECRECIHEESPVGELGIDSPGSTQAERLPDRIARYSAARARAVAMLDWLRANPGEGEDRLLRDRARALLASCGEYLVFRHYWTVGEVRLHAACTCRQHLICPFCAIRRGAKTLEAYLDRIEQVLGESPELQPYLITWTVKNGPDLAERFGHLRTARAKIQELRRSWRNQKRGAKFTELAKVQGSVGAYEVSNIGNGWHPHLHELALCTEAPDKSALQAEWQAITGDSFMVDVEPVRLPKTSADRRNGLADACMEVLKYAVKFADLQFSDNWEAFRTLRGKRLIFSLGCLFGVKVPESLTDEPLEGLPFYTLFYRYFRQLGSYSLTNLEEP